MHGVCFSLLVAFSLVMMQVQEGNESRILDITVENEAINGIGTEQGVFSPLMLPVS